MTPIVLLTALLGAGPEVAPFTHEAIQPDAHHAVVILAPREAKRAALQVRFEAGAFYDGPLPGLTRLTQFALLHASRVMSSARLTELLYRADATLEVRTGQRTCTFDLEAPASTFESVAVPVVRALLQPSIDGSQIASARQRLAQERVEFTPLDFASLLSRAVMAERGYDNDPAGAPGVLDSLTFDNLREHQRTYFVPSNATVAIAGKFNVARFKKLLTGVRGAAKPRAYPKEKGLAGVHAIRARAHYHVLAIPTPMGTEEEAAAAHLARSIVNERIYRYFHDSGYAYSAIGVGLRTPWLDFVLFALAIEGQGQEEARRALDVRINSVGATQLDAQDFEGYRTALIHDLEAIDANPRLLANELAMGGVDAPWLSPAVVTQVRNMTPDRFKALVAPWLTSKKTAHILIAPNPPRRGRR